MTEASIAVDEAIRPLGNRWWIFLVTGIGWILFANLILSFSYRTVWAVAVFTGFNLLFAGLSELAIARLVDEMRWAHLVLGVMGVVAGSLAFFWPDTTFLVLARLVAWVLVIRGALDIVMGLGLKEQDTWWWLRLVLGVVQIVVAFWIAGRPDASIVVLVLWVGVTAVAKGVGDIILAFRLRQLRG